MKPPHIINRINDSKNNVKYSILAYRKLTKAEMIDCVATYMSQPRIRRRKTPIKNKLIEIHTIIGYDSPAP